MVIKISLLPLIILVGFWYSCPAQTKPSKPRRSASAEEKSYRELQGKRVRTGHAFIERATAFQDLDSKTATRINIASLLWRHKGEEEYAREVFVNVYDELKLAASSQQQSAASPNDRLVILRLQQMVARFLARHDRKLAQEWLEAQISEEAEDLRARRQLDVALDLASDGGATVARRFGKEAIETDFSSLNIGLLLTFLHRLRLNDQGAADSLFIQTLRQLSLQPRVTSEDLLLIGNYLFINDADIGPDFVRFTPIRIDDLYFPVGINGERTGLSRQLVTSYLAATLAILNKQLAKNEVQFPRRYAAVARMLLLKAERFAPDFVSSFTALAHEFSFSRVTDYPAPSNPSSQKVVDYESVKPGLEKLQGTERDQRCLGLAATAYSQDDLDTASKLADLISDESQRVHLRELIAFRQAIKHLEKGDTSSAEQAMARLSRKELVITLQLGLANLDIKMKRSSTALPRLQTLVRDTKDQEIPSRALYLLSSAALLGKIDRAAGLQALGEALKAFDGSSATVAELSKREHLTTIQIGKMKSFFSISSKAVPFGSLDEALISLYQLSPQDTETVLMGMKNEKVLGRALVALARSLLEIKAPSEAVLRVKKES